MFKTNSRQKLIGKSNDIFQMSALEVEQAKDRAPHSINWHEP